MKELYNKIEKWIQENPDLIKTIKNRETIESSGMCLTYNNDKDKDLIYWYEEVKDHKDLILGDVIVTIEDINKLVKPYFVLRNEKDMIEMLAGNFEEGDYHWEALDKALCRITAKLFNYVYYTLGWKSREEYEKHLFNSMEFNDYIFDLYPPKNSIPTTKESKEKLEEIKKLQISSYAPFCVKYPKEMKQIADDIKHLEFVGYSLLDDESPIYKIKIPNGCEIVHQLDKYINEN